MLVSVIITLVILAYIVFSIEALTHDRKVFKFATITIFALYIILLIIQLTIITLL